MIWLSTLLLALAHLCVAKSLPKSWGNFVEKHSWTNIPRGWEYHSPAPAEMSFDLHLGLKQEKIDHLISALMEISDPNHERYGKHLSKTEAEAFVAPHPKTVEAVESWLEFHGINRDNVTRSGGGDSMTLRVTVAQAERMLGTKYSTYHHLISSQRVVRTTSYSLPRELYDYIDLVAPTTYFGTLHSMRTTSFLQLDIKPANPMENDAAVNATNPASCTSKITPACLRALYKTATYVPAAIDVNKLGVVGYLEEYANRADLRTFCSMFRTDAIGSSYTTVLVNGGQDIQSDPGIEANLDIQYTTGISFPTPNIYYSTDGSPPFTPDSHTTTNTNEPYLDWLKFILDSSTIPQTITTSYGDDEQTVPQDYAIWVCNLFAQLGSMGTTVFFSSGDFGVGGGDCLKNDGTNRISFQPTFPASCPFVTAVGGTTGIKPEVAVNFTGGGFSNYFDQPQYQSKQVSGFLAGLGQTFKGMYNASGRAYPDLSAQGSGFQVILGGKLVSVGGTSASSPTVAGIFSLLNDYRIANGKPSLGFINPLIYSTASTGFNDIVSGSNPGCGTPGFTARRGWDPVTGLGTPDFLKLQKLV